MKKIIHLITFSLLFFVDRVSSQNVGIGTLTPNRARLELNGAVGSTTGIFGGESNGISLQSNYPGIGFNNYQTNVYKYMANGYAAVQYLDPTNGFMNFLMMANGVKDATVSAFTGNVAIDNSGNMGIQTNPTNASLYVLKGNNFEGSAVFGGTDYNSHFHYGSLQDVYIRGGRSSSKVFINDLSGGKIIMGNGSSYVGINNGVPTYPLEIRQVGGRGMLLVEPANSFNNWEFRVAKPAGWTQSILYLYYNGQAKGYFVWGTGDYETFSDRRLKTDIIHMPTVLNQLMQLQPVSYEMKDPNTHHAITTGFIAQDVKAIFPELVTTSADSSRGTNGMTDMHAINYNGFTAVTIKAIQEQQQVIKEMRQFNKELARRIEIAEAILAAKK